MLKTDSIDDLVQQFTALLPQDLRLTRDELERNFKAALRASLARMDLVTREEFDVQRELLLRTRTLLEELEQKVESLEQELGRQKPG